MSMVRYNSNANPVLKGFFGDEFFAPFFQRSDLTGAWNPRVDVYEENEILHLDFEVPGVRKEDVKITLKDGVLAVSGEKHSQQEKSERTWYYRERSDGSFTRYFRLGDNYDASRIEAAYQDGTLHLQVPKKEEVKAVEIKVK